MLTKEECEKLAELLDKLTKNIEPGYRTLSKKKITVELKGTTYHIERWV